MSASHNAPDVQSLAAALCAAGYATWYGTLSGTPHAQKLHAWMRAIEPGHLVMETTTVCMRPDINRVGTLLRIEQGWFHSDEEWERIKADYGDQPRPTDTFWVVETLEGKELRWSNCSFVRLPRTSREYLEATR